MLDIGNIRKKFAVLSAAERLLIALSGATIFLWLVATLLVLNEAQAEFLSEYQVDKLVHFGGGIFVAVFLYLALGIYKRKTTLYFVFFVGILWEIFEIIFLPDQLSRFRYEFLWWFSDTAFDIIADVLGAYFWVNFFVYCANNAEKTPPRNSR